MVMKNSFHVLKPALQSFVQISGGTADRWLYREMMIKTFWSVGDTVQWPNDLPRLGWNFCLLYLYRFSHAQDTYIHNQLYFLYKIDTQIKPTSKTLGGTKQIFQNYEPFKYNSFYVPEIVSESLFPHHLRSLGSRSFTFRRTKVSWTWWIPSGKIGLPPRKLLTSKVSGAQK